MLVGSIDDDLAGGRFGRLVVAKRALRARHQVQQPRVVRDCAFKQLVQHRHRLGAAPSGTLMQRRGITNLQVAARLLRRADRFLVGSRRFRPLAAPLVKLAELREIARIDLRGLHERLLRFVQLAGRDVALRRAATAVQPPTAPASRLARGSGSRRRACRRASAAGRASSANSDWSPSTACSGSPSGARSPVCASTPAFVPAGGGAPPSASAEYTVPRMLCASTLSFSSFSALLGRLRSLRSRGSGGSNSRRSRTRFRRTAGRACARARAKRARRLTSPAASSRRAIMNSNIACALGSGDADATVCASRRGSRVGV